ADASGTDGSSIEIWGCFQRIAVRELSTPVCHAPRQAAARAGGLNRMSEGTQSLRYPERPIENSAPKVPTTAQRVMAPMSQRIACERKAPSSIRFSEIYGVSTGVFSLSGHPVR